jgi:hypothetical protein
MAISPIAGGPAVTSSIAPGVLQMNQQAWVWIGLVLGAAAGALGAYAGWRRAGGSESDSPRLWVAATTLGLALGLGAVIARIRLDPAHRLILLLPVVLLGYWFIRQARAIRVARGRRSEEHRERCHRK